MTVNDIKINERINEIINVWDVSKNPLADGQWYKNKWKK